MWYECLPPFMIMVTAMYIPGVVLHNLNKYLLGTPYKRFVLEEWDFMTYKRDQSLTGCAHTINGLDSIPDKKEE